LLLVFASQKIVHHDNVQNEMAESIAVEKENQRLVLVSLGYLQEIQRQSV